MNYLNISLFVVYNRLEKVRNYLEHHHEQHTASHHRTPDQRVPAPDFLAVKIPEGEHVKQAQPDIDA